MVASKEKLENYLNGRKASEVFLEYSAPYLKILFEEREVLPSNEELEKMLNLPWCIWNKIVSEEKAPGKELAKLFSYSYKVYTYNMPPGAAEILENLQQRKKTEFKQYKYFLGEYKVYKKNGIITLNIQHFLEDPSYSAPWVIN